MRDYDLSKTPPNQMLRLEYACDDQWIRNFLAHVAIGHVATQWDDQPFVTPTNFYYDPQHHEIYFHSNIIGRMRANSERNEKVCFEASRTGKLLPSNIALEFSIQYESVIAFGRIRLIEDVSEKSRALYALVEKYFPDLNPGEHYRPITDKELKRTAVYAMTIDSWSGKRNWYDEADQSPDWPPLADTSPRPLIGK